MTLLRPALVGFVAGVLSVLVFHQGTVALLHAAGLVPNAPFRLHPVPALGVPQLVSIAFWGGVWGSGLGLFLASSSRRWPPLLAGLLMGVCCSLVGFTVVAALRGQPLLGGLDPGRWWRSLLINGAFGWGVGALLLAARRVSRG